MGGLQFVLPGWPPGCCFPVVYRARSQVIMLVEAWADSGVFWGLQHCSHNGRVDFLKKKLAHQCPGCALGGTLVVGEDHVVGYGFCRSGYWK